MSKSFTKILTICSLVLVILAVVVASAICLTTTVSYKVTVNAILNGIENLPAGANKDVTIKINGKETNKLNVQKGQKVTIECSAENYNYEGWTNGVYTEASQLSTEVCTFEVNADAKVSLVFDAHTFHQVTVGYAADETVTGGKVAFKATGDSFYGSNGSYLVKEGTNLTLSYEVAGYDFVNWGSEENKDATYVLENITEPVNVSANVSAIKYNVKYGAEAEAVSVKYGETLPVLEDKLNGKGYLTFEGWMLGEKKYEKATFDVAKDARDVTLVADFADQSQLQYSFKQGGNVVAIYNTETGLDLKINTVNGSQELVGFRIKGFDGLLDESKTDFNATTQRHVATLLAQENTTNISVEAIWELKPEYKTTWTINVAGGNGSNGQYTLTNGKLTVVTAPVRQYYRLLGVKLGGQEFALNANGTAFADYNALYAYIAQNYSASDPTIEAEADWELAVNATFKLPQAYGDVVEIENKKMAIETTSLLQFLADNGYDYTLNTQFEINIEGSKATIVSGATNCANFTIKDALDKFKIVNNTIQIVVKF